MTPNPTVVSVNDAAMDALALMVENRFRHLPVVDEKGGVVGTLDIGKCLHSAITKLEKSAAQEAGNSTANVMQALASQKGSSKPDAAAIHALLTSLMSEGLGGKALPTVRSLLHGKPNTVVRPTTTIREAGLLMGEYRKAALVVDDGNRLCGVFTFKDMMVRAVSKELPLDTTPIAEVMTPEPETIQPDVTVLHALEVMSDHNFLTLPVCEADGSVVGLVDVMDVIYGCGGAGGWRSIFSSAMQVEDDHSSVVSGRTGHQSTRSARKKKQSDLKTVSKLRPSKPVLSLTDESVLAVAQLLQRKRGDASLVVNKDGGLAGVITDTDFTRRVVAKRVDPENTPISAVMTPSPTVVSTSDLAMDALTIMVENHFRHLPVIDDDGAVVGLLDIGKCLNDAISKLEKSEENVSSNTVDVVKQVATMQVGNAAALQTLLTSLLAAGGQSMPTLRSLLQGRPSTIVKPGSSIRSAGILMAETRKAALVVDGEGQLCGIFGFKDMMSRAIARQLPLDETNVSEVMTPNPESVSPDITVLEALHTMFDHKFLTLPVCEANGDVVGLVDVMDVIYGCGGTEGWRSIFNSAMELDFSERDDSTKLSAKSTLKSAVKPRRASDDPLGAIVPSNIPKTLEFETLDDDIRSQRNKFRATDEMSARSDTLMAVFKVTDPSNKTHRIKCEQDIDVLVEAVAKKIDIPACRLQLQYTDDEGDVVTMTSDDDVAEAWTMALNSSSKIAKLKVVVVEPKSSGNKILAVGGVAAAAVLSAAAFTFLRSKK